MIAFNTESTNPYVTSRLTTTSSKVQSETSSTAQDEDIESIMEKSAVKVSLSMNAQMILFAMDAADQNKNNLSTQSDVLNFLSGGKVQDGYSLEDIGYTGKPITELSTVEAKDLISEDGFFGVEQTSSRVAQFVLDFASSDSDTLEKAIEGIKQGFEEAEKLWGGKLPEISYQTQEKTLSILNDKLSELKEASVS